MLETYGYHLVGDLWVMPAPLLELSGGLINH
jgi:hypothetical protein